MATTANTGKSYRWPKTTGALVDRLYTITQHVKTLKKAAEAEYRKLPSARSLARYEAEIDALTTYLIENVSKADLEGAAGKVARCALRRPERYSIENASTFFRYVQRYKAWDLLPGRIVADAYRERLADGRRVPGVRVFTDLKLSVTKR